LPSKGQEKVFFFGGARHEFFLVPGGKWTSPTLFGEKRAEMWVELGKWGNPRKNGWEEKGKFAKIVEKWEVE
jgi:hypothetical protein